ncbi:MAG: N-acetylmuramoyl-L-alanine amidase [Enterocloster sp.]
MSNSSLVSYTKISPNKNSPRNHAIDRITPHCVVGQLSAESICGCFTSPSRQASCNYGIGYDGRISLCVEEKDRSWCSSSSANDHRAVTIECASDKTHPYAMTNAVYASLISLCVDICKRNGKKKLLWFGDKNKTLAYSPKSDEMVLTVHRWFANKSCPGDWLYSRMGDLAAKVTARLGGSTAEEKPASTTTLYRVRKTWVDSASQKGAFSSWRMRKPVQTRIPATRCLMVRVMLVPCGRASLHSLRIE